MTQIKRKRSEKLTKKKQKQVSKSQAKTAAHNLISKEQRRAMRRDRGARNKKELQDDAKQDALDPPEAMDTNSVSPSPSENDDNDPFQQEPTYGHPPRQGTVPDDVLYPMSLPATAEGMRMLLQDRSTLCHVSHSLLLGSEDTEIWREWVRIFREDSFVYPDTVEDGEPEDEEPEDDELEDGDIEEGDDKDKRVASSGGRL